MKDSQKLWIQLFNKATSEIDYYQRHGAPHFVNKYYEYQLKRGFQFLIRNIRINEHNLILEVGSGTGRWTQELLRNGFTGTYYGIDFNPKVVRLAQNKGLPNSHFLTMDGRDLGFASDIFDCAISIAALQHIPTEGWRTAVKEIMRVVKPSGKIVLFERKEYPWVEEFLKGGCKLLLKRCKNYSCIRELPTKFLSRNPRILDHFLTILSYPLEPVFEKILPERFAYQSILVFRNHNKPRC